MARCSSETRSLLRVPDERIVPVHIVAIPVDELRDALADIRRRLVAEQLVHFADVGVGVFGVAFARVVVLECEVGIDLVADDFGERYQVTPS